MCLAFLPVQFAAAASEGDPRPSQEAAENASGGESDDELEGSSSDFSDEPSRDVPLLELAPGWNLVGEAWYYGNSDGAVRTGWLWYAGAWYWLDPEQGGAMAEGLFDANGEWYLASASGALCYNRWMQIGTTWYFAASDGTALTGWLWRGGAWYWLDPAEHGAMAVGLFREGGSWYVADASGALLANCWSLTEGVWRWSDASGAVRTGWLWYDGAWYWLDPQDAGAMADAPFEVSGALYAPDSLGAIRPNSWSYSAGAWYHADSSGAAQAGWIWDGFGWYYLDPQTRAMLTGNVSVDGLDYYLDESGKMAADAWVPYGEGCGLADASGAIRFAAAYDRDGNKVLFDDAGAPLEGWQHVAGCRVYAQPGTGILLSGWQMVDGKWYYLGPNCLMETGWLFWNGLWYYLDPVSGAMIEGWLSYGGSWYYLEPESGAMRSGGWSWVGWVDYKFAADGRMVGAWMDVPCYLQYPELPTGCESVALTNLLRYYGYPLAKTAIAETWLARSSTDFVTAFGGNPFTGAGIGGCMAPAIVNAANGYLSSVGSAYYAADITGSSSSALYDLMSCGTPAVVWNTMYGASPGAAFASQYYNGRIYSILTNNHAVVLQGYDEELGIVYVSDSLSGNVTRSAESFFSAYYAMGSQAVALYRW